MKDNFVNQVIWSFSYKINHIHNFQGKVSILNFLTTLMMTFVNISLKVFKQI